MTCPRRGGFMLLDRDIDDGSIDHVCINGHRYHGRSATLLAALEVEASRRTINGQQSGPRHA